MEKAGNRIRILVVGEAASIHTARYVRMLREIGYDVRIFSNSPNSHQDEILKDTIIYIGNDLSVRARNRNILMVPFLSFYVPTTEDTHHRAFQLLKFFVRYINFKRSDKNLVSVIKGWNPHIVISLKMQNDGYVAADAKSIFIQKKDNMPPWVHFIWGTDIEFFGKASGYKDKHLPKIKKLLENCDYLIADTYRDLNSAKDLGFKGAILGKQIAQGGFNIESVFQNNGKTFDERDIILVKGRQGGYIGKALNVLDALHELKDSIEGFRIKIMMATEDVKKKAIEYSRADNKFYDCLERLDHNELMQIFSQSRITISATDVDGTPGFLLETMAMGAFPVHSDMESIREWIEDGKNGLLFNVDNIEELKTSILRALSDRSQFNEAQKHNFMLTKEFMDEKKIKNQTEEMIKRILLDNNKQKAAA